MPSLMQIVRDEIETPVTSKMDLIHLTLLIGIVMVVAALWSRVLSHLRFPTIEA